jgi:hypothetical protein
MQPARSKDNTSESPSSCITVFCFSPYIRQIEPFSLLNLFIGTLKKVKDWLYHYACLHEQLVALMFHLEGQLHQH